MFLLAFTSFAKSAEINIFIDIESLEKLVNVTHAKVNDIRGNIKMLMSYWHSASSPSYACSYIAITENHIVVCVKLNRQ